MSFNPFNEKPISYNSSIMNWETIYPKAYNKNDVDPYTKLRIILMNGTEYEAIWNSHSFHRHCNNNDIRRELCKIRRIEQQQQKTLNCIKPLDENILETTIGYEHLAVDLTAILARREKNSEVKMALDFALLEDFDHLYRYADLLNLEQGVEAEKLVGNLAEIMPGRPTIAEHRYPCDEIRNFVDYKSADVLTKLNIGIIVAAEQQTMNYYQNQAGFYTSNLGRKLYSEIAMIEEEHVSHYGSLIDPNCTLLESLLFHEYIECYLYYSCYLDETCENTKKIWEEHLLQEIVHLHMAADMLKRYEMKEWQQVIPCGEFPEVLKFSSQKEYVRMVLANTVYLTGDRENYSDVRKLSKDADFFTYQDIVNGDINEVASHNIINEHIKENAYDYRYEDTPNPIKEFQNRKEDNTEVGRKGS